MTHCDCAFRIPIEGREFPRHIVTFSVTIGRNRRKSEYPRAGVIGMRIMAEEISGLDTRGPVIVSSHVVDERVKSRFLDCSISGRERFVG